MSKQLAVSLLIVGMSMGTWAIAGDGVGNPTPGVPHDTLNIKVMKADNGPKECDGGHAMFVRHDGDGVVLPTDIYITMIDWVQIDNDGDGEFDEDPWEDGIDEDGDLLDGEDPVEPGATTEVLDCDGLDGEISLRIKDSHPGAGVISTQEWFLRLVGRPETKDGEPVNFAFTSYADQTVTCTVDAGEDGELGTDDDIADCVSAGPDGWVELAYFNAAAAPGGCVKQVKLGGKNPAKGGGKTPFCDITEAFEVDLDVYGDGTLVFSDQFVFSISCRDDPLTPDWDESDYCPLSHVIWDIDESNTTTEAKAQIFVGHTGATSVKSGKLKGKQ
jgi:hypothetical protein